MKFERSRQRSNMGQRIAFAIVALLAGSADADATQLLAVNMHTLTPVQGELQMVADAGFKTIRMDLAWASVERARGVYSFGVTDSYGPALAAHNLSWIAILSPGNPLYGGADFPCPTPAGIAAMAAFAGAFAARYSSAVAAGRVICELVNEPNSWINATAYSKIVAANAAAIKAAVPSAHVVGPASANIDFAWLTQLFEAGALDHFTAITVHPYRSNSPETALADWQQLRELVDEYAPPARGQRGLQKCGGATNVPIPPGGSAQLEVHNARPPSPPPSPAALLEHTRQQPRPPAVRCR